MSRPRHRWWGYAKNCIRDYPTLCSERGNRSGRPRYEDERDRKAVERAAAETMGKPDGGLRMEIIREMYWDRSHTMTGAAMKNHISYSTARRWHGAFVREVGRQLKLIK